MSTKEEIIQKIIGNKNRPHLNFSLKHKTEKFTNNLFYTLFDAQACVASNIKQLEDDFKEIYKLACLIKDGSCETIWNSFLMKLPTILESLNLDAQELVNNDPASNTIEEVYLAYPGFYAIAIYRFSHELLLLKTPLIPRLMSEYAHSKTGTDIHPGATIGKSFFIDHATGTVIGETCVIKDYVKIYQGVTLGALQVSKELRNTKRHPTVENNVTIYANATILGGETVIGKNCIIGGNVWITKSVPENSLVYHSTEMKLKPKFN
ncbi:MAG: serine acetyltransferase [Lutibacter sp.]|uniref:serine O-acetyltransferase n=1 Tax=Lutibacter sp. TaxID=1925666 RepID=UPI0017BF453A|nr:serine O-acetyltransferase [Lutibacter sp.]MBT8316424.1 serine O-acetyltransferase [Lutibacter sp.]NNJ57284.1 serine acetyltransferase [Lutibacter sp.]